jgi:hypothetical protein
MHTSPRRALLAIVAAAALTTGAAACGNDDDAAGGGTASPDRFCAQMEAAEAAFDSLETEDFEPQVFETALETLRAITPPAEISDDWNRIVEALEEVTDLFGEIDFTDPSSFLALEEDEELMQRFEDLETRFADLDEAGDRVADYVRDECGIDLDNGADDDFDIDLEDDLTDE